MKRDFSNSGRSLVIGEVDRVTNYGFVSPARYSINMSIASELGIAGKLNSLVSYENAVNQKNRYAKDRINNVYNNIQNLDNRVANILDNCKNDLLNLDRNIETLRNSIILRRTDINVSLKIVDVLGLMCFSPLFCPMTKYTSFLFKYIPTKLIDSSFMDEIPFLWNKDKKVNIPETAKKYLDNVPTWITVFDKMHHDDRSGIAKNVVGLLSSFCGVMDKKATPTKAVSNLLKLFKSSTDFEKGVYDYYFKNATPYLQSQMFDKYGKGITGMSVFGSLISLADKSIGTFETITDKNSDGFDIWSKSVDYAGGLFNTGSAIYRSCIAGKKVKDFADNGYNALRVVSSADGNKKIVNQILMTENKLTFGLGEGVAKKVATASTVATLVDITTSTVSSGIKRAGELYRDDNKIDAADVGSIMTYGSASGLSKVTKAATFGVVNFDGEKAAKTLEDAVTAKMNNGSWISKKIAKQDTLGDKVVAGALSGVVAADVLVEETGKAVLKTGEKIAKWATKVVANDIKIRTFGYINIDGEKAYDQVAGLAKDAGKATANWVKAGVKNLF